MTSFNIPPGGHMEIAWTIVDANGERRPWSLTTFTAEERLDLLLSGLPREGDGP